MYFTSITSNSIYDNADLQMTITLLPPVCLQNGYSIMGLHETSFHEMDNESLTTPIRSFTIARMYGMFVINFFVYLFLGFYLDNVLYNDIDGRKPLYFLFTKTYWCRSDDKNSNKVNPITSK